MACAATRLSGAQVTSPCSSCQPTPAAGAAPSLQVICCVATTTLRWAGAGGLLGPVASQQVPHPVWAREGTGPGDPVCPRLRPGSLPALSPPVVWGIGDCAVIIKGLKQFSVSFDFREQMLSPLFPHNVCRWQGFALPAAEKSGARLGSARALGAAWNLPFLHARHRENHLKTIGKMPCQQPAGARAWALSGKDDTCGVLGAGWPSGNWASFLSPEVHAEPLVCCPAGPAGVAIPSLCLAKHVGPLRTMAW